MSEIIGLQYGAHPEQTADLYLPAVVHPPVPGVLLIHGGGGNKSQYASIGRTLAKKGLVAAAINYREGPTPYYALMTADALMALEWLDSQQVVDGSRIGVWGGSMGGYLASWLGVTESVKAVENNFGPTDFTDPALLGTSMAGEIALRVFGVSYGDNPELYREQSPITHVSALSSRHWFFTRSVNDTLVPRSQMERMVDALDQWGITAQTYEYNGTGSGHANNLGPWQAKALLDKRINFMVDSL